MPVTKSAQLLATTICLLLGTSAFAQTTTPETATPETAAPETAAPAATTDAAPATETLSMGKEVTAAPADGIGSTYTAETFGSWEQRCVKTEDGSDPCQLYQLLKDDSGNAVAEISMFGLPAGQEAVAGATVIAPLETLLTADLSMAVDGGSARKYPFSWCSPVGCISRIGFTEAELGSFKKGNVAKLTIVPVVAPDQKVVLSVSLTGFTAGYDAVNKANGN
jgi:invasion protein IalB